MVTGEGKIAIDVYVIIEKVETTKQIILKPIGWEPQIWEKVEVIHFSTYD